MHLPLGQDLLIRLRSRRLRAMMKRKDPALDFPLADIAPRPVPKIIWSYWHSGEADAPETAARCFDSWRRLNPGWELRVLDETSHAEHAGMSDVGTAHVANWTDVLRTRLLARHGGVWADATLLCARPLDQWLPIAAPSGFFAFADPGPDRRIASWFLAAAPKNPFVAALERKLTAYWAKRTKASAYFYFHYLAEHLIRTDPAAAQVWLRTPRISARPMLTLHAALKAGESFAPGRFDCAPVHKLSWKGGPSWDEVSAALRLQG